jgi:hypothetical protein
MDAPCWKFNLENACYIEKEISLGKAISKRSLNLRGDWKRRFLVLDSGGNLLSSHTSYCFVSVK